MAKKRSEPRKYAIPTSFEQARDELFSHILRCGVLEATPEHQKEWFDDTMLYLSDRFSDLSASELDTSGTGAPERTATPSPTRPRLARGPVSLPAYAYSSRIAGGAITTSHASPASILLRISGAVLKVSVAVFPVSR